LKYTEELRWLGNEKISSLESIETNAFIERDVSLKIAVTPYDIAKAFCNMNADEQAEFFNYIEHFTHQWKNPFCFQLQNIQDSNKLTAGGKDIMYLIGQYSK
jgi:hypothetical protein